MEELHRHLFRHKQQEDKEQQWKALDILEENNFTGEDIFKAFVVACKEGNLPLVNWMMDMPTKMAVGLLEGGRYTLYTLGFWFACQGGHLNIINRLLDSQLNRKHTLKVDAPMEDTDVLPFTTTDYSIPHGFKISAFFEACAKGNSDVVQRLLELPAGTINFEAVNMEGEDTGFIIACDSGHLTVVNLLLQLPEGTINIQARGGEGYNGFMYACSKGHLSVIKSFLELPQGRFNIDETDIWGKTGLEIAVKKGHQDVAAAIRQYKRDISE